MRGFAGAYAQTAPPLAFLTAALPSRAQWDIDFIELEVLEPAEESIHAAVQSPIGRRLLEGVLDGEAVVVGRPGDSTVRLVG